MKRFYIYMVSVCAWSVLQGCGRQAVPEPVGPLSQSPAAIGISAESSTSRGTVTPDKNAILSLGVFGYSTGTAGYTATTETANLLDNVASTRTTADLTTWIYSPLAYWPLDLSIKNTFFAYSPYATAFPAGSFGIESSVGKPVLRYTVPEEVSRQIDLLYSEYIVSTNPTVLNADVADITRLTNDGKVRYKMKHAMCWIRFLIASEKFPEDDASASYTVKEFNFTAAKGMITTGLFDLSTGRWSAAEGGESSVDYVFDDLGDGVTVPAGQTSALTTATGEALMLIPQDIVQKTNLTTVYIVFTYNDGSDNDTEYYVTMPFPDVKFNAGSVLTYVIRISTQGSWIEFHEENTIEEWEKDNEKREIGVV